jgi:hypothetical protein
MGEGVGGGGVGGDVPFTRRWWDISEGPGLTGLNGRTGAQNCGEVTRRGAKRSRRRQYAA